MWPAASTSAQPLLEHQGYVTDAAGILGESARSELETRVRAAEARSAAEIAVVTVPSLRGMSVEEYGTRLFNEWSIGKKGSDNGVLILVAPTERKIRIEVGYGLEAVLPDGLAGEIIRVNALPAFRRDDYAAGIRDSVNRVASIVEANHVVTAAERQQYARNAENRAPTLVTTPFFGAFIAIGAACLGLGLRSKVGFFVLFGAMFGGLPFGMALIPMFNAQLWVLIPLAIVMFIVGFRKGAHGSWHEMARATAGGGSRHSSGWVMGGGGSSGSSSGSSSSSSSFGGGSSGGGGASGSW